MDMKGIPPLRRWEIVRSISFPKLPTLREVELYFDEVQRVKREMDELLSHTLETARHLGFHKSTAGEEDQNFDGATRSSPQKDSTEGPPSVSSEIYSKHIILNVTIYT